MMTEAVFYDINIATQILDIMQEIVNESETPMPVKFEELTPNIGELPRLMIAPVATDNDVQQYISGEFIYPFVFTLTLRQSVVDDQTRLDAYQFLNEITDQFLKRSIVLDNCVAYKRPFASVPAMLGTTDAFEDWSVTFDLRYKTKN